MPARATIAHYSLVAAGVAVLGLLICLQFSDVLPDNMPLAGAKALRQQHPGCALAEVPKDHIFVATSLVTGGAPTDLVIGSSMQVGRIVRVSVARGDKPISVFLSASNVIWEFAGDVGRVRRVVALSLMHDRKVAVAGIPADRVDFPVLRDCKLVADAMNSADEAVRAKALAAMFGRRPDHAVLQSSAAQVSLPDATFGPQPEQRTADEPGGLRALDPGHVVSALPITRPEILPGEAGLMQLEAAGIIRPPRAEEVEEFMAGASRPYQSKLSPHFRFAAKFDYAVTREATLPPNLFGLPDRRFLVLAGVPAPRGNLGRVCIAQMDGFRVNSIDRCLGHVHREAIERLRKLSAMDNVAHCRLLEPPESASLEAVAVYEPQVSGRLDFEQVAGVLAAARAGAKPKPAPIDVRVERAGDVVLVLSTYNPAVWRVSSGPGTRIVGAVLIGYYTSAVEGIAPDTPVVTVDHDGRAGRPKPAPACAPLQSWLGTAYDGGPAALVLDRQVHALTGRRLDGLHGAYRLKQVTVR